MSVTRAMDYAQHVQRPFNADALWAEVQALPDYLQARILAVIDSALDDVTLAQLTRRVQQAEAQLTAAEARQPKYYWDADVLPMLRDDARENLARCRAELARYQQATRRLAPVATFEARQREEVSR